jgi:hypothetical protein
MKSDFRRPKQDEISAGVAKREIPPVNEKSPS